MSIKSQTQVLINAELPAKVFPEYTDGSNVMSIKVEEKLMPKSKPPPASHISDIMRGNVEIEPELDNRQ
ncbi:unnamed protein product, partial [Iphiclides podalirius]